MALGAFRDAFRVGVRWGLCLRPVAVVESRWFTRRSARAKARTGRPRRANPAVVAARRLPCGTRSRGPSPNSLCSLRSRRSNRRRRVSSRSRCARGHEPCAPRRLNGAPRPARTHLCQQSRGVSPGKARRWASRQALSGGGDLGGDEQRRAGVGACSARASST